MNIKWDGEERRQVNRMDEIFDRISSIDVKIASLVALSINNQEIIKIHNQNIVEHGKTINDHDKRVAIIEEHIENTKWTIKAFRVAVIGFVVKFFFDLFKNMSK